jgi:nucleotide-binding universal stress UspA family protein
MRFALGAAGVEHASPGSDDVRRIARPSIMANWSRVLCAVDLHHDSRPLAQTAGSLARKLDAELTLLYVVAAGRPGEIIAPPERLQALVTEAGLPLRNLAALAAAALGKEVTVRVEHGQPASEILRVARETECDLLVLATHGRRGLGRALFGSVAESVVRSATCPVVTVRPR